MSEALNKTHFITFANKCKRAGITAIDVVRSDAAREVRLKYRGRAAKTGQIFNGEWIVAGEGGRGTALPSSPAVDGHGAAESSEKTFFEMAEKQFAVTRRGE